MSDPHKELEKQSEQMQQERIEELTPLVWEIIKLVSESTLGIGKLSANDNTAYIAVARAILEKCANNNIKFSDRALLFQLILQPFDQLRDIVSMSLQQSFDRAMTNLWGGLDITDLRLSDLDREIKRDVVENKA